MCWKGAVQSWRGTSYEPTSNATGRIDTTSGTAVAYELDARTEVATTIQQEGRDDEIRQASEPATEAVELPAGMEKAVTIPRSYNREQPDGSVYEMGGEGDGSVKASQRSPIPEPSHRDPDEHQKGNRAPVQRRIQHQRFPGARMPLRSPDPPANAVRWNDKPK
jgi:hypothetical protein